MAQHGTAWHSMAQHVKLGSHWQARRGNRLIRYQIRLAALMLWHRRQ